MTKHVGKAKRVSGGKGDHNQSDHVDKLQSRRTMCTTGGRDIPVNSRNLDCFIPRNQLPEEVIDVKYTKTGVKVKKQPINAEKLLVSQGRRHQMRLGVHTETGARDKTDQDGKVSQGPGIFYGHARYGGGF